MKLLILLLLGLISFSALAQETSAPAPEILETPAIVPAEETLGDKSPDTPAVAPTNAVHPDPANKRPRPVQISFEDELVTGEADTPDLMAIKTRLPTKYKKLLRLRENFNDESQKGQVQFDHP